MALFSKTKEAPAKKEKKMAKPKAADTGTKALYADEPKKAATAKTSTNPAVSQAYRILLRPLISEKASQQQVHDQYFFAVAIDSNRIEISRAVKAVYGVAPVKVNIIRVEGKKRNFGRIAGRRKDWKKAIVTLPKGKTISLYEGV